MNDLDTRLAVEVGLVYKAANEGKDVTIEAVAALEAIIAETCTAARLDEVQNFQVLDQLGTLERLNREVLYIDRRIATLKQPKEQPDV